MLSKPDQPGEHEVHRRKGGGGDEEDTDERDQPGEHEVHGQLLEAVGPKPSMMEARHLRNIQYARLNATFGYLGNNNIVVHNSV